MNTKELCSEKSDIPTILSSANSYLIQQAMFSRMQVTALLQSFTHKYSLALAVNDHPQIVLQFLAT